MFVVKLSGGLGNQLYQYVFGEMLALMYEVNVVYDISLFNQVNMHNGYVLDKLLLNKISTINGSKLNTNNSFLGKFFRKYLKITKASHIYEKDFSSLKIDSKNSYYFDGVWQKSDYYKNDFFKVVIDRIKLNITILNDYEKQILNKIINSEESISIHIRRGDYLFAGNDNIYGACDFEYYKESIKYIISCKKNIHSYFYVFSDDIDYAKELFGEEGGKWNYITTNSALSDFILMSNCSNHILANSTFSLFASILNRNSNKIVTYPMPWYKTKKIITPNIPSNYKAIKNVINE